MMPTLHVIDPLLKNQGGHFLGQHYALWRLCQRAGFDMVSYCDVRFDESLAPPGVRVVKVFGRKHRLGMAGHYCITLGVSNQQCLEELLDIDVSVFGKEDVVFLTSATAERVVAYGDWLRGFVDSFLGKIAIYTTISAEIEDTVARQLRRNGLAISEESFSSLDDVAVLNEVKSSMYRYLFDSIPSNRGLDTKVFYEEPFPNRGFLELCCNPDVDFVYLHSMYPGSGKRIRVRHEKELIVAYLGSGGVDDDSKGYHLLEGVISQVSQSVPDVRFSIHLGDAKQDCFGDQFADLGEKLSRYENVYVQRGLLDCDSYCGLIEGADIVILPYGPRYRHIMSGVFDDCLFLGIPCVVPKHSKMALWLERHNIEFSAFSEWNEVGVSQALRNVLKNFDHYLDEFGKGQRICRDRWQKCNPLSVFEIALAQ